MAGTAPEQEHSRKRRQGRRRGSLTPELIVKESLRLLDENGLDGFSLPKRFVTSDLPSNYGCR